MSDDFEPHVDDWPPDLACERFGLAYDFTRDEYVAPGRENRHGR